MLMLGGSALSSWIACMVREIASGILRKHQGSGTAFIKKLKRDKFISFNNPLIELNKYGTVSLYVDDGESMYKLMKDTMDECNKRYLKVKKITNININIKYRLYV